MVEKSGLGLIRREVDLALNLRCGPVDDQQEQETRKVLADDEEDEYQDVRRDADVEQHEGVGDDDGGAQEEDGDAQRGQQDDLLADRRRVALSLGEPQLVDEHDLPGGEEDGEQDAEEHLVARLYLVDEHLVVGHGGEGHEEDDEDEEDGAGDDHPQPQHVLEEEGLVVGGGAIQPDPEEQQQDITAYVQVPWERAEQRLVEGLLRGQLEQRGEVVVAGDREDLDRPRERAPRQRELQV